MFKAHFYLISCLMSVLFTSYAFSSKSLLQLGALAPDFTLRDENGTSHTLSNLRGHNVALIFYPRNQTPHCTKQLCSLRDGLDDLKKANIKVLAINPASPQSHKKFQTKYHLPFPLLSDPDKKTAKAYGAKRVWGLPNKRITVLIDKEGIVRAIMHDINVTTHAQEIIQIFQQYNS